MDEQIQKGDKIGNHYEVIDIIGGEGESSRGIIFVSRDNGQIWAIKSLQRKFVIEDIMINLFKRESLINLLLGKFPYIVEAKKYFQVKNRPFLVLEYIPRDSKGRNTITNYLVNSLSSKNILKWAIQICLAMEYAQSKGIGPHRDIKPDNIMVTQSKNIKLTDFSLSILNKNQAKIKKKYFNNEDEIVTAEIPEKVGGTAPYMAPEQFDGKFFISSDIYSIGIILYQLLNRGALPFECKSEHEFYLAHKNKDFKKIETPIFPIVQKCLKKKPKDRYQNYKSLRLDLEKFYDRETSKESKVKQES